MFLHDGSRHLAVDLVQCDDAFRSGLDALRLSRRVETSVSAIQAGTFGRAHTFAPFAEDLVLALSKLVENNLRSSQIDLAMLSQVSAHPLQTRLPNRHERVDGTFANLERRQMRQEIVADKEDQEDPIVDGPFEIEGKGVDRGRQLDGEILAQDADVKEDEGFEGGLGRCNFAFSGKLVLFFGLACAPTISMKGVKTSCVVTHLYTAQSDVPFDRTCGIRDLSCPVQTRPLAERGNEARVSPS